MTSAAVRDIGWLIPKDTIAMRFQISQMQRIQAVYLQGPAHCKEMGLASRHQVNAVDVEFSGQLAVDDGHCLADRVLGYGCHVRLVLNYPIHVPIPCAGQGRTRPNGHLPLALDVP